MQLKCRTMQGLHLNGRAVGVLGSLDVKALLGVAVRMNVRRSGSGWGGWGGDVVANSPDLVLIACRALPSLHLVAVRQDALGEVEALAVGRESNAAAGCSVLPLLRWEVVGALPDLHANTVCRA